MRRLTTTKERPFVSDILFPFHYTKIVSWIIEFFFTFWYFFPEIIRCSRFDWNVQWSGYKKNYNQDGLSSIYSIQCLSITYADDFFQDSKGSLVSPLLVDLKYGSKMEYHFILFSIVYSLKNVQSQWYRHWRHLSGLSILERLMFQLTPLEV